MASNLVKGTNWAEVELTALLLMWAEAEVQADLNGITRNKPIFDKLADRLVRECKFPRRTGQSCRDKINRIKSLYRVSRDEGRRSGQGRDDGNIPFWYEIVDGILGTKPATCPVSSFDSGGPVSPPSQDETPTSSSPRPSTTSPDPEARPSSSSAFDSGSEYVGVDIDDDAAKADKQEESCHESTADTCFDTDDYDDDDDVSIPSNVTRPDMDTTDELDLNEEDKKGKTKARKRKADRDTSKTSKLVLALHSSNKEVKDEMQDMEKRQLLADEKYMDREVQEREKDWQRRMDVEERRRREDREYADRMHREDRNFKMAMMGMMERQTTLMARMIGVGDTSFVQQPQPSSSTFHNMNHYGHNEMSNQQQQQQQPHQQHHQQQQQQQHQQQQLPPRDDGREFIIL